MRNQAAPDLGDYIDPRKRFVQRCRRLTNKRLKLTEFFRPDRDSHRAEVVFELGRLWSKTPPANLDAYSVTILRGVMTVFAAEVPRHFWFSRWLWQSEQIPVTEQITDLTATGLLPHYDHHAVLTSARPAQPKRYQIMELAGLAAYMGTTGERDDIGPITEPQGGVHLHWGNPCHCRHYLHRQKQAVWPWHFRDENTGAALDINQYPKASLYSPESADPVIATAKTGLAIDTSHQPAIAYLPFLLTGDPYFLEEMQFQTTYDLIWRPAAYRYYTGQVRAHAWSLRTLGQLARIMPRDSPKWLLPHTLLQGTAQP